MTLARTKTFWEGGQPVDRQVVEWNGREYAVWNRTLKGNYLLITPDGGITAARSYEVTVLITS